MHFNIIKNVCVSVCRWKMSNLLINKSLSLFDLKSVMFSEPVKMRSSSRDSFIGAASRRAPCLQQ